jgi:hypothetical protein
MATAAPPAPKITLTEAQRKIRHPLARLRTWIRGYVTLEGGLVLALYLALWFWLGLLLDYGVFKVSHYDWVQDMPWIVRLVVLVLLVAGLLAAVTLKVFMRLFTEFRDAALALVLEHKFPKILGDRLITAIELHDTRRAAKQGYSVAMIHQIVHEAADRVDQLPIGKVFNWKRLTLQTVAVVVLTGVCYLLALTGFAVVDSAVAGKMKVGDGVSDFHQVATIWFQRDVLLQDVIWPRRAHLELVGWPKDEHGKPLTEIRIGQNAPPVPIRFRASEWVLADHKAPEGTRPMTWLDVGNLLAIPLPEPPGDWQPRPDESSVTPAVAAKLLSDDANLRRQARLQAITADVAALQLKKFDVRKTVKNKEGNDETGTWFISDGKDGWRLLTWSDLSKDRLGGPDVPAIPTEWAAKHESNVWTLAEIDELLNAPENKGQAEYADLRNVVMARLERYDAFHTTFDQLTAKLAEPGMSGTARQLKIPTNVTVHFSGRAANGVGGGSSLPLTPLGDNEFNGNITDLKINGGALPWSFTFRARGEDYYTPAKKIVVVAAPNMIKMYRQERRPAYLYYRPRDNDPSAKDLRGQKQLMAREEASIFGGETTRIDIPSGTDVTLTCEIDKAVGSVHLLKKRGVDDNFLPLDAKELPVAVVAALEQKFPKATYKSASHVLKDDKPLEYDVVLATADNKTLEIAFDKDGAVKSEVEFVEPKVFRVTFENVRQEVAFVFQYTDKDGVVGYRSVAIRPAEEHFPDVDLDVPYARKTKEGIMITPIARIPLTGKVSDKFGLSQVRFAYAVTAVQVGGGPQNVDAAFLAAAIPLMNPQGHGQWLGVNYLHIAAVNAAKAADDVSKRPWRYLSVAGFDKTALDKNGPDYYLSEPIAGSNDTNQTLLTWNKVQELLRQEKKAPYRSLAHEYLLKPDKWERAEFDPLTNDFPLWTAKLLETEGKTQRRYLMQLRLEGVNTDIDSAPDGEPKVSPSKDTFTFIIVSEGELLSEIAKEEETLYTKLEEVLARLLESQAKLTSVTYDLEKPNPKAADFGPMSTRAEEIDLVLDKTSVICKEALTDYQRILEEYRMNQVAGDKVTRLENGIVTPLGQIADSGGGFDKARDRLSTFRRALDDNNLDPGTRQAGALKPAKDAKDKLDVVIVELKKILDEMEGLIRLDEQIKKLRNIADEEEAANRFFKILKARLEDDLFGGPPKPAK